MLQEVLHNTHKTSYRRSETTHNTREDDQVRGRERHVAECVAAADRRFRTRTWRCVLCIVCCVFVTLCRHVHQISSILCGLVDVAVIACHKPVEQRGIIFNTSAQRVGNS